MPELAEVEHARTRLERVAVGRVLERVVCAEDDIVFASEGGAGACRRALTGKRVEFAHRRGKYHWLVLSSGPHPVFHLGMTGTWREPDDRPLVLSSSPKEVDRAWPPRFTKLHLVFDDGGELAMTNARRLGRVFLKDNPRNDKPVGALGFDPWTDMPSLADFRSLLVRRRRAVLKGLLLDQKFAAGVGNWIADEVLFQAGIDPRRRVGSLSDPEVAALHRTLRRVVATAVGVDARKDRFPASWLFHHRWGKNADAKTAGGDAIEFVQIAGRTTAWVPSKQC
ncbi:MAG: DNA-formamidopyrimidine glycosylase family protein [Sandaracinaceae bacterium]